MGVNEDEEVPLNFINPKESWEAKKNLEDLVGENKTKAFDIIYDNTKALTRGRLEGTTYEEDSYLNTPEKMEEYLDFVARKTVQDCMNYLDEQEDKGKGRGKG